MIADLKPYPAMKNSGVPWLGEVPEHWEVRRLKQAFTRIVGGSTPSSAESSFWDGDVVWATPADVSKNSRLRDSLRRITRDGLRLCSSELVPAGSLVVTSRAPVGNVAIAETELCTNQGCKALVATPAVVHSVFGYHVLTMLKDELRSLGSGTTFTEVSTSRIGTVSMPVPPLPEQAAIVRFLDHADRRIRRYIRAKQKLIKLLEEQKQATIHRAVTRGLDPNVRLKPSGVEWLGDVPEHWEVRRLKTLVSRVTSGSRGWSDYAAEAGALFIRIGNLTRASIDLDLGNVVRLHLPQQVLGEAARTRVLQDDILLSITAFIGSVAIVPAGMEEAYVSQHVACCRPRPGVSNPRWIAYVLLSSVGQTHGQLSMYGGTKQGLSLDDVKNYVVLLPRAGEQDRLVDWIERTSANLDAGIISTKREIDLLCEYRTRLIADVVTGKLDVREPAARLLDEAEV